MLRWHAGLSRGNWIHQFKTYKSICSLQLGLNKIVWVMLNAITLLEEGVSWSLIIYLQHTRYCFVMFAAEEVLYGLIGAFKINNQRLKCLKICLYTVLLSKLGYEAFVHTNTEPQYMYMVKLVHWMTSSTNPSQSLPLVKLF